ncbi:hypothetical protein AM493_05160 [Flavobacterium akiainvivens]|uniref:Uncharacterized protein n=2 Tax=Flavobacterium akiainvivens TaxID=1202724 RepID=A0A0M8MGU3_9FLAO|nr:hypothetical protein AM493_05160 [Flavobacterium akiainvivens]
MVTACADNDTQCSDTVTLQSYEQDGYKLIIDYEGSATTLEASITSGNANPDEGIILQAENDTINFSQAGLLPGNYGLYVRSICNGGKSEWAYPIPIHINSVCDATVIVSSPSQNGTLFDFDFLIDGSVDFPLEARFKRNGSEEYITEMYIPNGAIFLNTIDIEPGNYVFSLRGTCNSSSKTVWSEGIEINIVEYRCVKPVDFFVYNTSANVEVYWNGYFDYNQWQFVYINEEELISTGTIQPTIGSSILTLSTSINKDLYVRGVCGENSYTDWAKVF